MSEDELMELQHDNTAVKLEAIANAFDQAEMALMATMTAASFAAQSVCQYLA